MSIPYLSKGVWHKYGEGGGRWLLADIYSTYSANATLGPYAVPFAPQQTFDVVLTVHGVTGSPAPGYLFMAPVNYAGPNYTGELMVLPFGAGIGGYRYRVTWPWITVALICNSCTSSNYYTIDLYLSRGI